MHDYVYGEGVAFDAIIIGSGPNGLVAANILADHGWKVLVCEAQPEPGGGVRSGEYLEPGFINDHCSSFHPLAAASPIINSLELEKYGLNWKRSPIVLAHPSATENGISINSDAVVTCNLISQLHIDDDAQWMKLNDMWTTRDGPLLDLLLRPFPPFKASLQVLRTVPPKDLPDFLRFLILPVHRLGQEWFQSPEIHRLLTGLALHADFQPDSTLSGFYGWLLAALAQSVGFPVPEGGAVGLTNALIKRLTSKGGEVKCNSEITAIVTSNQRAVAVRTKDGTELRAKKAILADIDAPQLYLDLLPSKDVPSRVLDAITRFHWDNATFKVDWNLDGEIPWSFPDAKSAATVHIGDDMDYLYRYTSDLTRNLVPKHPFLVMGQFDKIDPSRQPSGKNTAWAYTHVPMDVRGDAGSDSISGSWSENETEAFAARVENEIEIHAPGFKSLIRGRRIMAPPIFQSHNKSMPNGALGGGTSLLHQQLLFRPVPGLGRSSTPIKGLFLASSSTHPGGGVHGACGANAAIAALRAWQFRHARRVFQTSTSMRLRTERQ